jgi:drug/metabolite transporter (DMT)-like permease
MFQLKYLFIVLAAVIFSTMEILGKLAVGLNALQLNFLRFVIGGIILLLPAVKIMKKRNMKLTANDIGYFWGTGLLCVVVSMSLFQLAITFTKASTVAIIFSTNPVFTVLLAYFILGEELRKGTVVSIVFSLIGMILILNPFAASPDMTGIVLAIFSALTFSLYSVVGKLRSAKYGSVVLNCMSFIFGSVIMLILIFVSRLPVVSKYVSPEGNFGFMVNVPIFAGINSENIIPLILLGVVVTGFGYMFYFKAMDATTAATASIVFFIKPALAPVFAFWILNENVPLETMAGIGLILIGAYFTFSGKDNGSVETEIEDEGELDLKKRKVV